jgi:hypothetical protein
LASILLYAARAVLDATDEPDASDGELAGTVGWMMCALPEDNRDGHLRCRIYRALGDRT